MATGGFLNGNLVICGGQLSDNPISYAQRCEKNTFSSNEYIAISIKSKPEAGEFQIQLYWILSNKTFSGFMIIV